MVSDEGTHGSEGALTMSVYRRCWNSVMPPKNGIADGHVKRKVVHYPGFTLGVLACLSALVSGLDGIRPDAGAALCPEGQYPGGVVLPSYSQLKEDQFAALFVFPGMVGGTFIEVGGYNGLWMSNTKLLEAAFGWSGLLVEAHPTSYRELENNRAARSVTRNVAVCPAGMDSISFGLAAGKGSSHVKNVADKGKQAATLKTIRVPCGSLGNLTRAAGMAKIGVDFMSIDVEGFELEVLNSFDWSIPVRVAVVETDKKMGADTKAAIWKVLASAGLRELNASSIHITHPQNVINTWFASEETLHRLSQQKMHRHAVRMHGSQPHLQQQNGEWKPVRFEAVSARNTDVGCCAKAAHPLHPPMLRARTPHCTPIHSGIEHRQSEALAPADNAIRGKSVEEVRRYPGADTAGFLGEIFQENRKNQGR